MPPTDLPNLPDPNSAGDGFGTLFAIFPILFGIAFVLVVIGIVVGVARGGRAGYRGGYVGPGYRRTGSFGQRTGPMPTQPGTAFPHDSGRAGMNGLALGAAVDGATAFGPGQPGNPSVDPTFMANPAMDPAISSPNNYVSGPADPAAGFGGWDAGGWTGMGDTTGPHIGASPSDARSGPDIATF